MTEIEYDSLCTKYKDDQKQQGAKDKTLPLATNNSVQFLH